MLQKLRDKTSGWIAGTILGLLTIPFAFFGMEQYLFQRSDTSVAKIEAPPTWWKTAPTWWPATMLWQRETIEVEDFKTAFQQVRQQQSAQQGDKFDAREFESADSKRKVLDGLVDQRVLKMLADDNGIVASDVQVRDVIQGIPAFQIDGKFNPQQYQMVLSSQAPVRSPKQFEAMVREDIVQRFVPDALVSSAFATPAEVDRVIRLLGEKRDVAFAIMPAPQPDSAAVSAAEIQKWYDSHGRDYRAPETVTLEYVDIDGAALPAVAAADDATLQQRYEQEKSKFVEPEQRLASHILVKVDKDADAATQQAARQKAEKIAALAKAPGADFAALARADSQDSGSRDAGGDLGWVTRDMMDKAFEDALFAMQPGEVSGPVKSEFGWHVIQLREVKAGKQTPFAQVRDQLASEQAEADREREFNDLTGKLVDQVYKNPNSLAPAAKQANLPVQKSGPMARGQGTGVLSNPLVQRAAFSDTLIQDGTVSDPIEVGPGHSVLIRVVGHQPERQQPLAEVSKQVIDAIRRDRATKAAAEQADQIVSQVQKGKSLSEIAKASDFVSSEMPGLPRGAPVPDPESNKALFEVPVPAQGKVSAGKVVLGDGRIVIFAVSKVVPGDPKEATEEQRKTLQAQLTQVAGNSDAEALVKALRKKMKITISEDKL